MDIVGMIAAAFQGAPKDVGELQLADELKVYFTKLVKPDQGMNACNYANELEKRYRTVQLAVDESSFMKIEKRLKLEFSRLAKTLSASKPEQLPTHFTNTINAADVPEIQRIRGAFLREALERIQKARGIVGSLVIAAAAVFMLGNKSTSTPEA